MCNESIGQEFRLKSTDKTRSYFLEEIKQNELMSKKHKKVCTNLNYSEHLLCNVGSKKYKPIIKKKKRKHDKTVLLAKSNLDRAEVLISTALIDSVISHDEFSLINNVLKNIKK